MSAVFREAVARFRTDFAPLDENAEAVLDRLTSEKWLWYVFPVFEVVPREGWAILLGDCLHAVRVMRQHKRIAEHCRCTVDKAEEALKALDTVAGFVKQCTVVEGEDPAVESLGALRVRIDYVRRDAALWLRQNSRKTDASAARSAAFGWLRESVEKLSGKPNLKHVASLAEAALDLVDVTEGAVGKAVGPSDRLRRGNPPRMTWAHILRRSDGRYQVIDRS